MKRITLFFVCLMFAGLSALWAQNVQISGVVTDPEGITVPGVSVLVKGTKISAVSDVNGQYSISAPADAVLEISAIGMKPQEISVNGRAKLDVAMVYTSIALDEVVVTAMGIKREKKSIGYATQEVKAEKLTITPQTDLNNALVGKVAGVRFWGASGATFDAGKIVLRGSINISSPEGDEPIYVVDGVITNVNSVNMEDVESINVLKGPAATALYGSRGGTGAVIITSKKGAKGKGTVEFSQSVAFENVVHPAKYQTEYGGGYRGGDGDLITFNYNPAVNPPYLQALNGKRYYDMENDESWGPRFDGQPYAPWWSWDPTHPRFGETAPWVGQRSDNLTDLFRQGFTSTTNVSFSKSVGDFNTRVAFSNVERMGVMENSNATRRHLSISTAYNVNERLSISLDYKYTYRKNHNPAGEEYSTTEKDIMYSYTQWFNRNVDIKELHDYKRPDGTFRTWNPTRAATGDLTALYHNNPFALMNEVDFDETMQWNVFSGTVKYDIIKKILNIGTTVNGNLRNALNEEKVPYGLYGYDAMPGQNGRYYVGQNTLWDMIGQGFMGYQQRFFNDKLAISANAFVEFRDYDYRSIAGETDGGLTFDRYYNLAASVNKPNVANSASQRQSYSVYGTGIISWDNTYYLDFSARNDWSSTLHPTKDSYFYAGLSGSIIFSNYLPKATWIDYWKIRASLAQVGSDIIPYQIYDTYVNLPKYGNYSAMRHNRTLLDPYIRPTISTSYEIGTEFQLFGNRLYGDFNYYTKDSKDQIIELNMAPSTGYTLAYINAGLIRNEGIEFSLGGAPIKTKDFQWDLYVNFAKNNNTLVELDASDPDKTQYRQSWMGFSTYLYLYSEVGQPLGTIRGSDYERSPDGQIIYLPQSYGSGNGEAVPYRLTSAQNLLGSIQPDATGGFGTSFNYKGFRLSMGFDFQIGGQVASVTNMFGEGSGLLESTVGMNDMGGYVRSDVWTNDGGVKVTGVTRNGTGATATYTPYTGYMDAQMYYNYKSSLWAPYVYDATYLKMRELALTYTLPADFINKLNIGLSQASIAFNVQNPWLIYSGVPNIDASEIGNSFSNYIEMGQVLGTRIWGFTLKLTF